MTAMERTSPSGAPGRVSCHHDRQESRRPRPPASITAAAIIVTSITRMSNGNGVVLARISASASVPTSVVVLMRLATKNTAMMRITASRSNSPEPGLDPVRRDHQRRRREPSPGNERGRKRASRYEDPTGSHHREDRRELDDRDPVERVVAVPRVEQAQRDISAALFADNAGIPTEQAPVDQHEDAAVSRNSGKASAR